MGADTRWRTHFPLSTFNDRGDANPEETFAGVVDVLNGYRPEYLHVVEDTIPVDRKADFFRRLRSAWKGIYVANGGYDAERGESAVSAGSADAVAYGRRFLAMAATNAAISTIRSGQSRA